MSSKRGPFNKKFDKKADKKDKHLFLKNRQKVKINLKIKF